MAMRKIVGFDADSEGDWRAILDCGHRQHVRHRPPLIARPWVLTESGRASRLGVAIECKRCDGEGPMPSDTHSDLADASSS